MIHRLALATFFVFLSLGVVRGQTPQLDPATKSSLEKAKAAYLKNDFETAKQELKKVQASKKDLAEPYLLLGMIAWQEAKIGDAIKSLKDAIKYQPEYSEAHYVLGKLYFEKMSWKEAEDEAQLAILQGAKFANLYVLLGDALLLQSKSNKALEAYELAITLPPPNSDVTGDLKERMVAVKNFVEIFSHKDDPNYKRPEHIVDRRVGNPFGVSGKVKIAGVLNEKGEFKPFALISSDATAGQRKALIQTALAYRFSPATINGKPVLFWLMMAYEKSISRF